jgi:hypothetical protein
MSHLVVSISRALLVMLFLGGGFAAARAPKDRSPRALPIAEPTPRDFPTPDAGVNVVALVGQDPFRAARRPPSPRYLAPGLGPDGEPEEPAPPPTPRPEWTLTGVIWGSPPLAVFDGVPDNLTAGLLAEGDSVGPIRVDRIAPDTVYLRGVGAAWAFVIEVPWKTGGPS